MTKERALEKLKSVLRAALRVQGPYADGAEIGALKVAIKALERQIPKKPVYHGGILITEACPNCGSEEIRDYIDIDCEYGEHIKLPCCPKCHQIIDWSKNE